MKPWDDPVVGEAEGEVWVPVKGQHLLGSRSVGSLHPGAFSMSTVFSMTWRVGAASRPGAAHQLGERFPGLTVRGRAAPAQGREEPRRALPETAQPLRGFSTHTGPRCRRRLRNRYAPALGQVSSLATL